MSLYQAPKDDGLPRKLPATLRRERVTVSVFGGGESLPEGQNLSPRAYPALATRRHRGMLSTPVGSGTPHGMAVFGDELYFVRGTVLYRMDSEAVVAVGTVSDTDKQFFVFGERLYIYPDKLYVEAGGTALAPMELDTGVLDKSTFKGNTVTLPVGLSWTDLGFRAGDCLRVVNADNDEPAPEGYYRLLSVNGRVAVVQWTFPVTYESTARFKRVVPDLKRVCVNGNRVYGIAGKDVYVSAAGSALDFYSHGSTDGSDPAILRLDSDGELTACVAWQGYVVFFKPDRICKLLGTRADSFSLQDRPAVGITARLADTLCEVGGDLYYLAESGVYRYRGQEPERISTLGDQGVRGGYGGTDGDAYYLALKRPGDLWQQYCFVPERGEWYAEDGMHPICMIRRGGFLCIQADDGYIWLASADGRDHACLYHECHVRGDIRATAVLPADYGFQPEGCRLVGVSIRATSKSVLATPTLEVLADFADAAAGKDADGTAEVSLGLFSGKMTDRLLKIPVTPRACDAVKLRLALKGDWVIHSVTREYERAGQ